jgi:hypothetical protein
LRTLTRMQIRASPLSPNEMRRLSPIDQLELIVAVRTARSDAVCATARKSLHFVPAFVVLNGADVDAATTHEQRDSGVHVRLHRARTTAFVEVYAARTLDVKSSDELSACVSLHSLTHALVCLTHCLGHCYQ